MTTVTKALDHLTDVLAGSDVTLKGTKADCIMQLADMIEDGTIVIGGGGGGGSLMVTFSQETPVDPWVADATVEDISDALEAGKVVQGRLDFGLYLRFTALRDEGGLLADFVGIIAELSSKFIDIVTLTLTEEGVVLYDEGEYDLTSLVIE